MTEPPAENPSMDRTQHAFTNIHPTPEHIGAPSRSVSQEATLYDHTLHTQDTTENIYRSCCGGSSDKRLIILAAQICISILVVIFSAVMLILYQQDATCGEGGIYMSLLSSTIAFWFGRSNEDRK